MSRGKKREPLIVTISKVIIFLCFFTIAVCLIFMYSRKKVVETVTEKVTEQVVKEVARENGLDDKEVSEILESVDEEDKEVMYDIIDSHANSEAVKKAIDAAKSGDVEAVKQMAMDELSEEEIIELKRMYEKYKNQIEGMH